MATRLEENLSVIVGYHSSPVCEVRWVDRDDPTNELSQECSNKAEYTAIGHDEVYEHTNHQLLMCTPCLELIIKYAQPCVCGSDLVITYTRL